MSASVDPKSAVRLQDQFSVQRPRPLRQRTRGIQSPETNKFAQVTYALTDLLFISLNASVVFCARFVFGQPGATRQNLFASFLDPVLVQQIGFLVIYALLLLLAMASNGMYEKNKPQSFVDNSLGVGKCVLFATLLLTAIIYVSGVKTVSRLLVGFTGMLTLATLILWRLWFRGLLKRRVERGEGSRNTLIVGASELGQAIARHLEDHKHLGYTVKGFLDSNHRTDPRLLGRIEEFSQVARAHFIDEILIVPPAERDVITKLVWDARQQRINVKIVPDVLVGLGRRTRWDYVGEFPVAEIYREPIPVFGLVLKRAVDIAMSAIALIITLPFCLVCAVALRLDSRGDTFYRSWRVGKKGRKFVCYKFRTMVENADELKDRFVHLNEREGLLFKITNDPRVTRVGKILRKYSIDEIPQFWNVLKGDMSLVGPRPPVISEYEQYNLEQLRRMDVMPGITGLWQVSARHDPSFENYVAWDLEYIENWNLWLDLKIMLQTLPVVLKGTNH